MNYSVFSVQNKSGKTGIFWEKETVPKNDRKFGYKKKEQRFPLRRFPGDHHVEDGGFGTLTPDEAPPPPKPPAKDFIKRNKERLIAQKKKKDQNSTVTLTQEQLNAILKSVGKVADNNDNRHEIKIESPRRDDRVDDYEEEREKRRPKKKAPKRRDEDDEGPASIYSLIGKKDQLDRSQDGSGSDVSEHSEAYNSELEEKRHKTRHKNRRETKSKRRDEDEYSDRGTKERNRSRHRDEEDYSYNAKDNRRRSKHRDDGYESDSDNRNRRNRSRHRENYDDTDDFNDESDNRRRRLKPKYRDSDNDDDSYVDDRENKDRVHKGRTRNNDKSEKSRKHESSREKRKDRKGSKDRDSKTIDLDDKNTSGDKLDEVEVSPRDKVGLPNDLSWRHMTKAERLRLNMARQRFLEEEERKEEERIHNLMVKYGGMEPAPLMKPAPEKKKGSKSDQSHHSKNERVDTEESGYRDHRRGRRSPSDSRSRTPERSRPRSRTPEYQQSSPNVEKSPGISGIPRAHMTLAEKKRIEWERDRVESVQLQKRGDFDPWGRPVAGAPLRSKSGHVVADYKNRQEVLQEEAHIPEEKPKVEVHEDKHSKAANKRPERETRLPAPPAGQENVPHASMRSSFVFGGMTEVDKYADIKEQERKQWLAELEKQIEEKKMKEMKNKAVKQEETWADKLGQSHKKLPFPEQPKDTVSGAGDPYASAEKAIPHMETNRVQSAPEKEPDDSTFIRGQNVPIDPVTRKEMEEKRRRYLEHQAAVKAQVEEKERLKRLEREKKLQEDLEEERKLQAERDMLQKQYEMEQQKIRQKEQQRQAQVNMLKAAMDEAQAKALQEKYQRKMQHLEKGGHDTKKLRENLEGQITSRIEQLHTRRERDILRAQKLQELSEFYQGQTLSVKVDQDIDRDVQIAKITPRSDYQSEAHGGVILNEPHFVPGLDLVSARTTNFQTQYQPQPPTESRRMPVHHEPYLEDRVLTPTRFRRPSKPWSDPSSPRREFGTQTLLNTSLDDGDAVSLLNNSFNREQSEVHIEYKIEKGKKVRVQSAPKEALQKRSRRPREVDENEPPTSRRDMSPHMHHHEHVDQKLKEMEMRKKRIEEQRRKGPVKPGSRPKWNYKNSENRKVAKQSERDPFYLQKKRDSEFRRQRREQQLLAMVEANKEVIPDYHVPSSQRARTQSPHSDYGGETPREVRLGRRSKSHSPKRPKLETQAGNILASTENLYAPYERTKEKVQEKLESQTQRSVADSRQSRPRNRSPPVPAIKHRYQAHDSSNIQSERGRKGVSSYSDIDPLDVPLQNGDFVPFTRTIDVLDPAKAEDPLPLSREATEIKNARKVYHEGLQPYKYGNRHHVFQDKQRLNLQHNTDDLKNPIMNPALVMDHPTARQDQILMQLSTLKQSLMQRQRELETFSPTDLEKQNTYMN